MPQINRLKESTCGNPFLDIFFQPDISLTVISLLYYSFTDTPYWVLMSIPSSKGVIQVLTLGLPLTTITQSVHLPMAQNRPLGL